MFLTGCPREKLPAPAEKPRPSLTLRVLVVNVPELAKAINRLQGEWSERGSGELDAVSTTWANVAAAKSLDADIIVFPSRYLGELCMRGWLRPVRLNVLESDDFNADDFFPLVRRKITKWDGQIMAVSLGAQLVPMVDARQWRPALRLLARAAPHVVKPDRIGVLFNSETMTPRIAEREFVEALEELVSLSQPELSAEDGEVEFSPDLDQPNAPRALLEEEAETAVPVVGHGDPLAAVTSSSRNAASAFRLLEWLASAGISSRLDIARAGFLPVRRSLATSAKWYPEGRTEKDRLKRAKELQRTFNSQQCLAIPRLPGVDKYLAVLDSEVKAALDGKVFPQSALDNAARAWERITDAKGRDKQREAYLKHLGIAE